jgi:hypothetical protein
MWPFDYTVKLDKIIQMLNNVLKKEDAMALDLSALEGAVVAIQTAVADAAAELQELVANQANTVDPAAVQAIAAKLNEAAATLEADVAAAKG